MRSKVGAIALIASGTALVSCTTMGGNIKGSFSCKAPDGICAPSSTIDDRALAMIAGEDGDRLIAPTGPYIPAQSEGRSFQRTAAAPARSQERVLRIVFPARIDGAGRLHEQTAVHAVVEQGDWQQASSGSVVVTTPAQVRSATGGDTLLAAIDRVDQGVLVDESGGSDPDMPTAAAVAAARAQADPIGEIKDQVARRLSRSPHSPRVPQIPYRLPAATTDVSRQPTASAPTTTGTVASPKPRPSSAPNRPAASATSAIAVPKLATPEGRAALAAVSASPSIQAGLAQVEPEAREAAKATKPIPVLRPPSFPGVDQ